MKPYECKLPGWVWSVLPAILDEKGVSELYDDDNQYEELRTLAAVELQRRVTKLLHCSPESFAIKIKIDKKRRRMGESELEMREEMHCTSSIRI